MVASETPGGRVSAPVCFRFAYRWVIGAWVGSLMRAGPRAARSKGWRGRRRLGERSRPGRERLWPLGFTQVIESW